VHAKPLKEPFTSRKTVLPCAHLFDPLANASYGLWWAVYCVPIDVAPLYDGFDRTGDIAYTFIVEAGIQKPVASASGASAADASAGTGAVEDPFRLLLTNMDVRIKDYSGRSVDVIEEHNKMRFKLASHLPSGIRLQCPYPDGKRLACMVLEDFWSRPRDRFELVIGRCIELYFG
jgi:hypothetical protein